MPDDLRYEPPKHRYDWLIALGPASCLVIGNVPDDDREVISGLAPEVRTVPAGAFDDLVHRGAYAFHRAGIWRAVVMGTGLTPTASASGRTRYTEDDSHLVAATFLHRALWPTAEQFAGRALFRVGDMVRVRGGAGLVGRIKRVVQLAGAYQYQVDMQGEIKRYSEESLVLEEGDPRDPSFWLTQPPVGADGLSLTLTWTKLRHPLTDTLYSFASSKTVFRPYQFKPVLKVVTASSGRLLIADEVGLGKTIEAGLIWNELEQRSRLDRVLVVAPAVLTLKWKSEMGRRFDRQLEVLRARELADFADRLADGDDPPLRGIVSLESLRGADELLDRLTDLHPRFGLVIVDEAHYLRNSGTKSHALGRLLADWSDYLIFLSATPLNLGSNDLFNLLSLLDEGHFGDPALFEAQLEPNQVLNAVARSLLTEGRREPRKLVGQLDILDAMEFGSSVTDRPDYQLLRRLLDVDRPLIHEEIARARRLLADLNMLGGVLTRTRKADVPDNKAIRAPRSIDVEWTEQEKRYYESIHAWYMSRALQSNTPPGFAMQMPLRQAASCIAASQELMRERNPGLFRQEIDDADEDVAADIADLFSLPTLAVPVRVDTKYDRLLAELVQVRLAGLRQVMIFSFFRRTLGYLARRLGEHFTVRVMHGGVAMADRERIMDEFRAGEFEILLLSEVGSEGLDFEFCNVLVNYDLPWNPMRVEQRIGRLDRFGQKHEKIFIYNMHVPGTIETDIFQRLYDRIGVFESSIGALEPILRDELSHITRRLLDPRLSATERLREADRIGVALQQRAHDTDELRAARTDLSGLDGLLVEGLTEAGPDNGRFIGAAEIQRMLDELFSRTGGRRGKPNKDGIFKLVGTAQLAERLRSSRISEDGSRHLRPKLAALMQNEEPLDCTLRPEVASRHGNVELLSARHPLIKLAQEVLSEETLALPRFGAVRVPGIPGGHRYLVTLDLAETTGLRPLLELWATAIDLGSGQLCDGVGDLLLTALAEGRLQDGASSQPEDLRDLWEQAQQHLAVRHRDTERARRQENMALVRGRIRAQQGSLDLQIGKTRDLVARLRAEHNSPRIIRLHEGRLRNLRARREEIRHELTRHQELAVSLTAVAVALIE
ncbi:DEAD/DEAH box helicase [Micromonospora peucetia]|uniref:Helicase conserved C-terminal domain-containing protein n=1 Tax=Micromonospora peucetia TaxID=47871 RepID=A0A1C6W341_9ACTN|nr:helicase-related protein [Micromonospora peucetia]MCX4391273.1 DEAD/DEAH box helicase [Micromonospora peucetia]SCL72932.1 Helicase conserved C-terminal domain-containing protein [Micromonospora peucetia]